MGDEKKRGRREAQLGEDLRRLSVDGVVDFLAEFYEARRLAEDAYGGSPYRRDPGARQDSGGHFRHYGERSHRHRSGHDEDDLPRLELGNAPPSSNFLFDLTRLQVDILKQVLTFQRQHADTLFQAMRGYLPRTAERERPLRLKVELDEDKIVEGKPLRFLLDNRSPRRTTPRLSLSRLRARGREGVVEFPAERVSFEPKALELHPDEDMEVTMKIEPGPCPPGFLVDHCYHGFIEVRAQAQREELPVRIDTRWVQKEKK